MKSSRLIGSCTALTSCMDPWRVERNRSSERRQAKLPPFALLITRTHYICLVKRTRTDYRERKVDHILQGFIITKLINSAGRRK